MNAQDRPRRFPQIDRWSFIDGLAIGVFLAATVSSATQDYLLLLAGILLLASALVSLVSYQANR